MFKDRIVVDVNRTTIVTVNVGFDVSGETITSEIRKGESHTSELIAAWDVTFATDGTDGALVLTLQNEVSSAITQKNGYMDFKRVANGEPLSLIRETIPVVFRGTVTA